MEGEILTLVIHIATMSMPPSILIVRDRLSAMLTEYLFLVVHLDTSLALTGFEPVSSGSKPDILDRYTIGLTSLKAFICFYIFFSALP